MKPLMTCVVGIALWGAVLTACGGRDLGPSEPAGGVVGPEAVWRVDRTKLGTALKDLCGEIGEGPIDPCFRTVMKRLGASPAAVRFSESLGSAAHLQAFEETGPVDVGWVHHPFRANERFGCLLLNGTPSPLDVDDPAFWPMKQLKRDARYRTLREAFPDVAVWPGGRLGHDHLVVEDLPENGVRFVLGYELRNGCHACDLVGSVDFAFDFDGKGAFLESRPASFGAILHVVAGRVVTLSVGTGTHEPGRWKMVRMPPSDVLQLKSKAQGPDRGGEGQGGVEAWSFLARRPGRVLLHMRRVPSSSHGRLRGERASFLVVIHRDDMAQASALADAFAPIINQRLEEMGSPRVGKLTMNVVGVHGDLARVDIHPRNPHSDAWAMVYLKRRQEDWNIVGMGRSFSRSWYRSNGVPHDLRGPGDPEAPYVPIPAESCREILEALSKGLGLEGKLEEVAPFFDPSGPSYGEACRVTLRGAGDRLPGLSEVAVKIRTLLQERGYEEDPSLAADGPLGTAAGFRKEDRLVRFRVVVEPAADAGLLSNRPVSVSELLPEERVYTIVVEGADRPD